MLVRVPWFLLYFVSWGSRVQDPRPVASSSIPATSLQHHLHFLFKHNTHPQLYCSRPTPRCSPCLSPKSNQKLFQLSSHFLLSLILKPLPNFPLYLL